MKKYIIEFKREFEDKDFIIVEQSIIPNKDLAITLIKEEGYIFNEGYDEIKDIREIK